MKRLWILCLIIPIIFLFGCAQVNQFTLETSKQDLINAENSRKIADNMMSTWSLNSGAIQCGLGSSIDETSLQATVRKIDDAVKQANKWNDADYQKGCFLGLQGRLATKTVEELIRKMVPIATKIIGTF